MEQEQRDIRPYKDLIEKYRSFDSSSNMLKTQLPQPDVKEDIFLRLHELNQAAYASLDREYFDDQPRV